MTEDGKRVVFVSQRFTPEKGGNASRIHDTVTHLGQQGWEPIVLSPPPCYPPGEFDQSWNRSTTDTVDGITVHRLWTWQPQVEDPGMLHRLPYYLLFGIHTMLWLLWNMREYDMVVTSTPPISTGSPGLLAALIGKPWIVDVRDLWIDASVSLGYISEGSLIERVSRRFQQTVLHAADRITVTTEGTGESLQETYGESLGDKIVVIPNGVDIDRFQPKEASKTAETAETAKTAETAETAKTAKTAKTAETAKTANTATQLEDRGASTAVTTERNESQSPPEIIYTGNLGTAQDLESCIRALPHLSHDDTVFRIVGSGDRESALKTLAIEQGVDDRVEFTGLVDRDAVPGLITDADIGLAPLKSSTELAYAMPTKLYEYMACGLPVVVTGRGEVKRFVDDSGGGVHAANDPKRIAEQIDALLADPEKREQAAVQGRAYVEQFDRGAIASRLGDELTQLHGRHSEEQCRI